MTRKLISTILAAAIAVTTISAVPAQAGNRELKRAIVGVTALAIIGSALANEGRANTTTRHESHYTPNKHDYDGGRDHYKAPKNNHHQKSYQNQKHAQKHYTKKRSLPGYCRINAKTRHGWTSGYALRCTKNNVRRPAALPSDCIRKNFGHGPRLFYSAHCMRKNGYRT